MTAQQTKLGLTTLAALGLAALATAGAQAQAPGTIYVDRIGDGTAALSSAGTAIFLDQYSIGGALGTSLNLSTATTNSIVNSGTAGSEGGINLVGNYLTFAGYNTAVGTAAVTGTTAPRGVGIYNIATSTVDTSTMLGDAFTKNNIRTAVTTNGTNIFAAGTGTPASSGGIRSATLGATTTTQVESSSTNTRYVEASNGNIYFSTGSTGGVGAVGVYQVNFADPVAPTKVAADTNLASPYGFVFAGNGSTLYVADSTNGLVKYTLSGGTATYAYTIALANISGLAFGGTDTSGNNVLYAVNGANGAAANTLVSLTDTGSTATFTTLATAAANESFKGVAFAATPVPAPEPSGWVAMLLGAGTLALVIARRRTAHVA